MTGVAALMCGNPSKEFKYQIQHEMPGVEWGQRKAILNDLSPIATFISNVYNREIDIVTYENQFLKKLRQVMSEYGWVYKTHHEKKDYTLFDDNTDGIINYTVWSDVLICPHCGEEIVFWDAAVNPEITRISDSFN